MGSIADQLNRLTLADIGLLLELARVSCERQRERGSYYVGGELFGFESRAELDRLISAALDERSQRGRPGTTAA